MSEKQKKHLRGSLLMTTVLMSCFGVSMLLQNVLSVGGLVHTVFVFGVFLISLLTEGYFYGIVASFFATFAINFAFTFPYFSFNFTIPVNLISALLMIVISVMTGTLLTKMKKWQAIKAEGEREIMRANLLRAVSHDLRTPLTTIYGSSSAILEEYESFTDTQRLRMVEGIKADAEWLIRMVENLLSVTRIDSGAIELHKTPTVLDELIDSVLLKFKKRYPASAIQIDLPDEMVLIPMDAILIEQVLLNILENAVKHAKGMRRLWLRVFVLGGGAIFEIVDDGCGISRDRLDRIFEGSLGTHEPDTDGRSRSCGIGLSVCASIVKAHGGQITAENAKSGGAIFRFSLAIEGETENDE